jgi:UDP-N-acetylmuramoyl-L-alanyl-D-glutamate--2,6-diaminopimelate ligase
LIYMQGVSLGRLLEAVPEHTLRGSASVVVSGYAYDSRAVEGEGMLFAAFEGAARDGHDYIADAVARGAAAIMVSRPIGDDVARGIPVVTVPDCRRALALLARELYGRPETKLRTVGVTGTKGKTTTTHILHYLLNAAGLKSGLVGTAGYTTGAGSVKPAPNTTPEGADLERLFHEMVVNGLTTVVMEVSSHALSLGRTALITFDAAAFTNLGHDHMDFHPDVEHYAHAKSMLFSALRPGAAAVVNEDDPYSALMADTAKRAGARVVAVSLGDGRRCELQVERRITASDVRLFGHGSSFTVADSLTGRSAKIESSLAGAFNVSNTLVALGLAVEMGLDLEWAAEMTRGFSGVRGRFESVNLGQGFSVIVDFAHTPDSLRNVLVAARKLGDGKLISVFGCGGDRDRTKRPRMGAVSRELADFTIVTSDNPRSEEPSAITAEIAAGMGPVDQAWTVILDRRSAIRHAVAMAAPGDVLVIAGKGHETYQIFRDRTIHFDDVEEARQAIGELMKGV